MCICRTLGKNLKGSTTCEHFILGMLWLFERQFFRATLMRHSYSASTKPASVDSELYLDALVMENPDFAQISQ